MKVSQHIWAASHGWTPPLPAPADTAAQLVLGFGSRALVQRPDLVDAVRAAYPQALFAGCSSAGEIAGVQVFDDTLVATAVQFERSTVRWADVALADGDDGADAARRLAATLAGPGLRHVFVLCDGLKVNGSALAEALRDALPAGVCATGGLAADADRFEQTLVCANTTGRAARVLAIGLYGDALRVGFGSLGGWDTFGPPREVTRAQGNLLFELDGQSALALYKTYLGEHVRGLPGSALQFPLLLEDPHGGPGLVRSVLGVDEAAGGLIFAGDMPQGAQVRLMKANFDRLVDGASGAATASIGPLDGAQAQLALLVSCVGRKLVLRQRIEEEVESVRAVLPGAVLAGFYAYGELCPHGTAAGTGGGCELHNQTMTVTALFEA